MYGLTFAYAIDSFITHYLGMNVVGVYVKEISYIHLVGTSILICFQHLKAGRMYT